MNGVAIKIEGMPETQMGGEGGLWAKGMPIARGKGTNFDNLMEIDLKHTDPVSGNMELTVKGKGQEGVGGT